MRMIELVAIYDDGRQETVYINPHSVDYVEPVPADRVRYAKDRIGDAYVGVAGRTFVVMESPGDIVQIINDREDD